MNLWKRLFGKKDQGSNSNEGSSGAAPIPPGRTPPGPAGAVDPLKRCAASQDTEEASRRPANIET